MARNKLQPYRVPFGLWMQEVTAHSARGMACTVASTVKFRVALTVVAISPETVGSLCQRAHLADAHARRNGISPSNGHAVQ